MCLNRVRKKNEASQPSDKKEIAQKVSGVLYISERDDDVEFISPRVSLLVEIIEMLIIHLHN